MFLLEHAACEQHPCHSQIAAGRVNSAPRFCSTLRSSTQCRNDLGPFPVVLVGRELAGTVAFGQLPQLGPTILFCFGNFSRRWLGRCHHCGRHLGRRRRRRRRRRLWLGGGGGLGRRRRYGRRSGNSWPHLRRRLSNCHAFSQRFPKPCLLIRSQRRQFRFRCGDHWRSCRFGGRGNRRRRWLGRWLGRRRRRCRCRLRLRRSDWLLQFGHPLAQEFAHPGFFIRIQAHW
jgi:hypothetical protein